MSTPDLTRLAKAVKAQRLKLFRSRLAAATAAGMSKDTWQRVEEGLEVYDSTYLKIESVLQWAEGSCAAILEGGEATSAIPVEHGAPGVVKTELSGQTLSDEELRESVQLSAIATTGLSADEIRALSERVVQDLRKRGLV
jgi:hypothetical protein